MQLSKFTFFLFFSLLIFTAKPFAGFCIFNKIAAETETNIIVKAFTKRKLEFVEDSDFDIIAVQKRLADPILKVSLIFSFFLKKLFPRFHAVKSSGHAFMATIRSGAVLQPQKYLLTGKLII